MTLAVRIAGLALAAALLSPSRSAADDAGARCLLARARLAERVRAAAPACSHDWDCVPFASQHFGCELFLDRSAKAPPAALAALESACGEAPVSAAPRCTVVGACDGGRCTSRAPSGQDCDGAVAAARARATARTLCEHDSECGLVALDGAWYPVPDDFWIGAEHEQYDLRDRCAGRDPFAEPDLHPRARCREGLCRLAGEETPLRGPRVDRACIRTVIDRQAAIRAIARKQARVFTRFAVDPQGAVGEFWFPDGTPGGLASAVAAAIQSCKVEPGLDADGKPVPISVALPLSFR